MATFRILYIDDDPLMTELVSLALGREPSFQVTICASGVQGLTQAARWLPHLIICDVLMPGLNGPGVLSGLQANSSTAAIPFIFMTASARAADVATLIDLGAKAVIAKPFKLQDLAALVRGHLGTVVAKAVPPPPLNVEYDFVRRLRSDGEKLKCFRSDVLVESQSGIVIDELLSCVHKLSGAAGIYEFNAVSTAACAVECAIADKRAGRGNGTSIIEAIDVLLGSIGRSQMKSDASVV